MLSSQNMSINLWKRGIYENKFISQLESKYITKYVETYQNIILTSLMSFKF